MSKIHASLAYLTTYSARPLPNGLYVVSCRATRLSGVYAANGIYISGDLRLATWAVRPLLTVKPTALEMK